MSEKKRENWIDFVKLLAMLVVVMNHAGCNVRGVSFWGGMFFVPVFFVLSGYTYKVTDALVQNADKAEKKAAVTPLLKGVIKKKAKRLLVPYICANIFLFVFFLCKDVILTHVKTIAEMLNSLVGVFYARNQVFVNSAWTLIEAPDEKHQLMTILNSPTWFLPALFLTIALFELALMLSKNEMKKLWLIAAILFLVAVIYHYVSPVLLPWSIDSVPLFYVMLLTGYTIKQMELFATLDKKPWIVVGILACLIVSATLNGSTNFSIGEYGKSVTLALYNAISSSVIVMYALEKSKKWIPNFCALAGRQTLFILCYHMLLLAILEIALGFIPLFVRIVIAIVVLSLAGGGLDSMRVLHLKKRYEANSKSVFTINQNVNPTDTLSEKEKIDAKE